jgi:hypothetical protein
MSAEMRAQRTCNVHVSSRTEEEALLRYCKQRLCFHFSLQLAKHSMCNIILWKYQSHSFQNAVIWAAAAME